MENALSWVDKGIEGEVADVGTNVWGREEEMQEGPEGARLGRDGERPEEMELGRRPQGTGGQRASSERSGVAVKEVDDAVDELLRDWRHGGAGESEGARRDA